MTLDQNGKASLEALVLHYNHKPPAFSRKTLFGQFTGNSQFTMGRNFTAIGRKSADRCFTKDPL